MLKHSRDPDRDFRGDIPQRQLLERTPIARWFWAGFAFAVILGACNGDDQPADSDSPTAIPTATSSGPDEEALTVARRFDERAALEAVRTLADPSYMGRHVGTSGELKGAQFIADAFQSAGLEPGGDGSSYLQTFPLTVQELAAVPVLELTGAGGETRSLRLRDDFRPVFAGPAGGGDVMGPGFFAGSGNDLPASEVAGKVLLVVPRDPSRQVIEAAREAGALAVIFTTGQDTLIKAEGRPPDEDAIPAARVSVAGSEALLEGSGHSREELNADIDAGRQLPTFPLAWTIHLSVSLQPATEIEAHNVIGVLPGESNTSRTVVVGAHYEEIGPDPDGVVFPAANDNASGTAVLIELADLLSDEAFKPDANIVFVGWSGHEEGLFGSSYYLDHPTFPVDETILYLNLDVVGQGASPNLEAFYSEAAAREWVRQAVELLEMGGADAHVEPLSQPEGISDDTNFIDAGVPSLSFLWGGIFEYEPLIHTPEDTADIIDPDKLDVTGEVSALVLIIASR